MEKRELIAFKGMVDGVRINLDKDAPIFEILSELEGKVSESKGFFGDGDCRISFGGRRISEGEKLRLTEVTKRLLPLCRVEFDEERKQEMAQTDWILAYKERAEKPSDIKHEQEAVQNDEDAEFVSVFRSNRARLYQGTVKEGMTLRSDGHLVLIGSVMEGGALIAAGNIVVVGGLYGSAHAGCNGHNGSYIIAMDMRPQSLAVAKVGEEYVYRGNDEEEIRPDDVKKGIFDKFRKKDKEEENPQSQEAEEYRAVALLRNNKIEVEKFSIQDFTN